VREMGSGTMPTATRDRAAKLTVARIREHAHQRRQFRRTPAMSDMETAASGARDASRLRLLLLLHGGQSWQAGCRNTTEGQLLSARRVRSGRCVLTRSVRREAVMRDSSRMLLIGIWGMRGGCWLLVACLVAVALPKDSSQTRRPRRVNERWKTCVLRGNVRER